MLLLACTMAPAQGVRRPAGSARPKPPAPAAAPTSVNLMVTSTLEGTSTVPGVFTLDMALAAAADDPRDNVIQFAPAVFGSDPVVIRLTHPIVRDGRAAGHDRIDGGSTPAPITLDFSACPDAGVTLGGQCLMTFSKLTLAGGGQRVALVKDRARLNLDEVLIRDSGGPGLAVFGDGRLSLSRCRLTGNRTHGIELHGSGAATIDRVEFHGNGQSALAAFEKGSAELTDCRMGDNGEWNLVLTQDSRCRMTRCVLRGARFANGDLSGSAILEAADCTLGDGLRFGVFATGESRLSLTQVTLRAHASRGIELQDAANLALKQSVLEANGDYGVILFGKSAINADAARFVGNGAHGASLRDLASGSFTACVFTENRYSGIGCLDGSAGGKVLATRCLFARNGMRPIYRGPLHLEPMVPVISRLQGDAVFCEGAPNATVELFFDRVGEAARYHKTVKADRNGRFQVSVAEVPAGWVMTAAATIGGETSEFNVIAGAPSAPILSALLGRTGAYSDAGGPIDLSSTVRRWKPGTRLLIHLSSPPSREVETYLRRLVPMVNTWAAGGLVAELRLGPLGNVPRDAAVVEISYMPADDPQLQGRGGVTYMKWDASGHFLSPMEIVLATASDRAETCPRVLAHELGHALGLCHTRSGLLSRMQGSEPPGAGYVNDFSPIMTYYDVLALQILHDPRNPVGMSLRQLADAGRLPITAQARLADAVASPDGSTFSPPVDTGGTTSPTRSTRSTRERSGR